jgi:hypothetical protein
MKQNVKGHAIIYLLYFVRLKIIMIEENVILVNKNDEQIGLMPKLEAHEKQFCIVLFSFCFE